jgi:TP901 family phage tail tape measure protein
MATGSAAWVDVLPNMAVFSKTLTAGAVVAGKRAGMSAGKSFSTGMTAGSAGVKATTASLVDQMQSASKKAAVAVRSEKTAVSAARNAEKVATQNVAAAEVRLQEQRAKSGSSSSQALKAEAQLTAAKGREELATAKLSTRVDALKAAQTENRVVTEQLTSAQAMLAKEQASSTTGFARFKAGAAEVESASTGMVSKLKSASGMLGTLGAGFAVFEVAGFVKESFQSATEFQKDTNVLVTAAGESQKALAGVRTGLLGVSSNTGASLEQLSEGMYTVEKAGIRGAAGVKVMGVAAKGAADEGADLGVVSNALTTVMQNYAGSMKSPTKAMNAIMVAAGHSKTSLQDFAGSLSSVLPVASKVGIPFNQIAGALGTMTASGMSAQQASQDLNHTIASLASPTRVMSEEMNAFGLDSAKVRDDLSKKGLQGTIEELSNAVKSKLGPAAANATKIIGSMPSAVQESYAELANGTKTLTQFTNSVQNSKKLTDAQKTSIMSAVPAARGYTQAMKNITGGIVGLNTTYMLTGSSAAGFADRTTDVGKAMNSTADFQKKWNLTSQTTATRLAIAKATLSNVGTSIASDVLPALAAYAKNFAVSVRNTVAFVKANKAWVVPLAAGILAIVVAIKSAEKVQAAWMALSKIGAALQFTWSVATNGMTAAVEAYKLAQIGASEATVSATAAQTALDAAMDANPIGLVALAIEVVVAALAALVAGVIYAYKHWTWFRVGVQAVWKAIQVAASFAWNSVLKPTFAWIAAAAVNVGNWFVWLWKSVIVPAWNGIAAAVRVGASIVKAVIGGIVAAAVSVGKWFVWLGGIAAAVGKAIAAPFVWLAGLFVQTAKAIAAPFVWLWNTILAPVFKGIGAAAAWMGQAIFAVGDLIAHIVYFVMAIAWRWLYSTVILPVSAAIGVALTKLGGFFGWLGSEVGKAITTVGGWFSWLWTNAIVPAWNGIVAGVQTGWRFISGVFTAIGSFITDVVGAAFTWLYQSVIAPVWGAISTAISWAYTSVIKPVFGWIGREVATMGAGFTLLYTKYIKPAWDWISSKFQVAWDQVWKPMFENVRTWVTKTIPNAFSTAVGAIGKAWDAIKDAVKTPIRFVVNTVIDDALIGNFNKLAKFFGSAQIAPIKLPKGFAAGGVIPGYQSAKRDDILMPMRRGEGVLVPEVNRALPGLVPALNRAGNSGGVGAVRSLASRGLATGGIVGESVDMISSFISNPGKAFSSLVGGLEANIPGLGGMVDLAKGAATKLVGTLASGVTHLFGAKTSGTAGGSVGNPTGSGVNRWKPDVIKALAANGLSTSSDLVSKVLRQIQTESGGNPAAVQHGYTDVNTLSGDLAKGLMQTISATFNAYKFPGHGDIFNGYDNLLAALHYAKSRYGSNLNGLGEGHGYAYGGVVGEPTLMDNGGMLTQTPTLVANRTRKPEYALPEDRLIDIVAKASAEKGGNAPLVGGDLVMAGTGDRNSDMRELASTLRSIRRGGPR